MFSLQNSIVLIFNFLFLDIIACCKKILLKAYEYEVLSPFFLFIIDPSSSLPLVDEVGLAKETLDTHNTYICSSPIISHTCEANILVLEEPLDESCDNLSCFYPLTSPTRHDITKEEDFTLSNHDDPTTQHDDETIDSSPRNSPICDNTFMNNHNKHICEENMLISRNPMIVRYNIISPLPNISNNWKALFEQEDPLIETHANPSCSRLHDSPICDEALTCDASLDFHLSQSYPTRVDTLNQDNEIMDNNQLFPSPNISPISEDDIMVLHDPIHENQDNLMWVNIIEQHNSTINNNLSSDEFMLDEPNLNCHEHVVCCSPIHSPSREDIMIQDKDNTPFEDNDDSHLLRDVNNIQPH